MNQKQEQMKLLTDMLLGERKSQDTSIEYPGFL